LRLDLSQQICHEALIATLQSPAAVRARCRRRRRCRLSRAGRR
jgi:hypothetical protein